MEKRAWILNRNTKWKVASLVKDYKEIRKLIKKESKKSVRSFEEDLTKDKKNPKRLFAYVNSKQSVKAKISSMR